MDRFTGSVAVVTGSNVGIGAAISKELLKKGLIVAGLARREEKLQEFKKELDKLGFENKFYPVKCDITNEQDVISAFMYINENVGNIVILINNAGVCPRVPLHEANDDVISTTLNTNVKGVLLCARQAIKIMKENSTRGHIVNLCSIAGQPGWMMKIPIALYSASKHAVKVISDGLRREMIEQKTQIKVSNLSPGLVETDMTSAHIPPDPTEYMHVQDIANACLSILNTPPNVVISELTILPINEMV